jgi:transcriptional regulator with XRE-family HTH domain
MSKRTPPSHPQARRQIAALGVRLRAARLRRKMTQPMLAERVGVSVPTIGKLEDGDPSTSLATMLRVLSVLGLAADIDLLAAQDTLGRSLQDNELKRAMPKRAKKSADGGSPDKFELNVSPGPNKSAEALTSRE